MICATRIGAAELVVDGLNGFRVGVWNSMELANRVELMVAEPEALAAMKRTALSVWDASSIDIDVVATTLESMIFTVS